MQELFSWSWIVRLGDVDESIYSAKERMKESANTKADPRMSH